jgi:ferric-dicitrate binding protein FerR (iron transport regulator)
METDKEALLSLAEAHMEGSLGNARSVQLRRLLLESPDARRTFWKYVSQDAMLAAIAAETAGGRTARAIPFPRPIPRRRFFARKSVYAIAASLALLVSGYFLLSRQSFPSAMLVETSPGVIIERENGSASSGNGGLKAGDVIKTPPNASLVIGYRDGTRVEVKGGSRVKYQSLEDTSSKPAAAEGKVLFLQEGQLTATVVRQKKEPMVIRTNQAEVTVLGTRFNLSSEGSKTRLEVIEGSVSFRKLGEPKAIVVGQGDSATTGEGDRADWMLSLPASGTAEHPALLLTLGKSPPQPPGDPGVRITAGDISAQEGTTYVATQKDQVVVARWGFNHWKASFRFNLQEPVVGGGYDFYARWMQGGDPKVCPQTFEIWAGPNAAAMERRGATVLTFKKAWTFEWFINGRIQLNPGDTVIEVRNSGPGDEAKVFQAFLLNPRGS